MVLLILFIPNCTILNQSTSASIVAIRDVCYNAAEIFVRDLKIMLDKLRF